jgi:hypothetical protein
MALRVSSSLKLLALIKFLIKLQSPLKRSIILTQLLGSPTSIAFDRVCTLGFA